MRPLKKIAPKHSRVQATQRRRLKKKNSKPKPPLPSDLQKEAERLIPLVRKGDWSEVGIDLLKFTGDINQSAVPEIFAMNVLSRVGMTLSHYEAGEYNARAFHSEHSGKTETADKPWVAVVLTYLHLCRRLDRAL